MEQPEGAGFLTRLAAAKARSKTFTGLPCKLCAGTLRYTSSTQCVPCSKRRASEYGERIRKLLKGEPA